MIAILIQDVILKELTSYYYTIKIDNEQNKDSAGIMINPLNKAKHITNSVPFCRKYTDKIIIALY